MSIGGINKSQIDAMVAQLKATAARMDGAVVNPLQAPQSGTPKLDFAEALQNSLDQVNAAQMHSQHLGKRFSMGDESVQLSDVMISMQKANISFQTTVQVRNKLVSAYHDIMNMQI